MKDKITILTAASSNHFSCLMNLIWSVNKFAPTANVVVYDIGLTAEEAKQVPNIRTFDFSKYPSYFNMKENAGRMAFRPIITQDGSKEFGGVILWLDAGCLLTGDITELITYVKKHGVYAHRTSGTIGQTLHPTAHKALGVTDTICNQRLRDAGIAGFDTSNPNVTKLIDDWASAALNKDATAPDGSSRKNHRQDSVFSALLYKHGFTLDNHRVLNIKMRQDNLSLAETKRRYERFRF